MFFKVEVYPFLLLFWNHRLLCEEEQLIWRIRDHMKHKWAITVETPQINHTANNRCVRSKPSTLAETPVNQHIREADTDHINHPADPNNLKK